MGLPRPFRILNRTVCNPVVPTEAVAHGRRNLDIARTLLSGFTRDYAVTRLVWFKVHETMESAITREKRLKERRRAWKIVLIETANPEWLDLAIDLGLPRRD